MSWDNVTNTVSVTDGAGTNVKSVVITGFLESEVDGDINNELITAFTWNDGTDLLRITEAGANWDVWIDNEADDLNDNNLNDLGDVNAPAPADGQVLTWVGGATNEWQALPSTGGVTSITGGTGIDPDGASSGAVTLTADMTELTLTGLSAPTATSLSVIYGNAANTAVQGNTAWSITAGNGLTADASGVLGSGLTATLAVGDIAGDGITANANNIQVNVDGTTIEISGDVLQVVSGIYDDYDNWKLQANGGATVDITSGATVNFAEGTGIDVTRSSNTITIAHEDESSQGSINLSGGVVIQDLGIDWSGHVTSYGSVDLDGRYLQAEVDDDVNNELITAFTWNDGTDQLTITEAGTPWTVTIDNEADDVTLTDVQNACANDFHNIGGIDLTDDADVNQIRADANPYLQGDITLASGTDITLAQAGQTITINYSGTGGGSNYWVDNGPGTYLSPGNDWGSTNPNAQVYASGTATAYFGGDSPEWHGGWFRTTYAAGGAAGVVGVSTGANDGALGSASTAASNVCAGVFGVNANATGIGVWGLGANSGGTAYIDGAGVIGEGSVGICGIYSSSRYGYMGTASVGAYGQYDANINGILGGANSGVQGISNNVSGAGVFGSGGAATTGVYGTSSAAGDYGVWGYSSSATGFGVLGSHSSGPVGLIGSSSRGVEGQNGAVWGYLGGTYGVYGDGGTHYAYLGGSSYALYVNGPVDFYWVDDLRDWAGSVGSPGQVLKSGGAGGGLTWSDDLTGGGGGSPGGVDAQMQYNNGGAFGGASNFYFDDVNNQVSVGVGTTAPYLLEAEDNDASGIVSRSINVAQQGTGLCGTNNNEAGSIMALGSGISGTGYNFGVFGVCTNPGYDIAGGYYDGGWGLYSYIAFWNGADWGAYGIYSSGVKSTIVEDLDRNKVTMFCTEAPEVLFQDFGKGKLINGKAVIELDPVFAKNVRIDDGHPLRVFVQLEDDCNGVYVTNKSPNGFDVIELNGGTSNTEFTWMVIANRADATFYSQDSTETRVSNFSQLRFPPAPGPQKTMSLKREEESTQNVPPETPPYFDAYGVQIPPEWVEELREAGVEMFTYDEMMERRKQKYLDEAKAAREVAGKPALLEPALTRDESSPIPTDAAEGKPIDRKATSGLVLPVEKSAIKKGISIEKHAPTETVTPDDTYNIRKEADENSAD